MDRNTLTTPAAAFLARMDSVGHWLGPRALLAYEPSRLRAVHAAPGHRLAMATWIELVAGVALLVGFGTRYAAAPPFVLTIVAMQALHWPVEW